MNRTINLFRLAGMTALLAVGSQAGALTLVDCPASFTADGTAKVYNGGSTAASACQYLSPADNSIVANTTNVNAAGFFGTTTWELAPSGANQSEPANGLTGAWSVPGANFATYDYMLTFKDGADTNLISFLLNELFSSGNWNSPFTDPPFDLSGGSTVHGVSHYSLFRRLGGSTQVPEPAILGLLGLGLLSLGLVRRRRVK